MWQNKGDVASGVVDEAKALFLTLEGVTNVVTPRLVSLKADTVEGAVASFSSASPSHRGQEDSRHIHIGSVTTRISRARFDDQSLSPDYESWTSEEPDDAARESATPIVKDAKASLKFHVPPPEDFVFSARDNWRVSPGAFVMLCVDGRQ